MKLIFLSIATVILASGTIITVYRSSHKNIYNNLVNVRPFEKDLKSVEKANEEIHFKDKQTFQYMADVKIRSNENRIAELREKVMAENVGPDLVCLKKIHVLEERNNIIKIRKQAYEQSQNDPELFRVEFNDDIENVGQELKDLKGERK